MAAEFIFTFVRQYVSSQERKQNIAYIKWINLESKSCIFIKQCEDIFSVYVMHVI